MRMARWICVGLLAMMAWSANGQALKGATVARAAAPEKWDALVDEYFEEVFFRFAPTAGTSAGLHRYDALL